MEHEHLRAGLDAFFASARAAPRRALLLDYDGTLAPFHHRRDQAVPYPGVRECLSALLRRGRTRVVIISGRATADLIPLLGVEPLPELWGSHGWERRRADGRHTPPDLPAAARAGLEAAIQAATACGLGHALEPKPAGLALHWRGLDARTTAALREEVGQVWAPIVLRYDLKVTYFDGGIELRVPGYDKGTAVRACWPSLARRPPWPTWATT